MSELRRNPLTQKWILYHDSSVDLVRLQSLPRHSENAALFTREQSPCPYCGTDGSLLEILRMADNRMEYRRRDIAGEGWQIRVVAAPNPVFRIEDTLHRHGRRLYDTMGSPGAHEIIVMTPHHDRAIWDLDAAQLDRVFRVIRERMVDLERDTRLGHQYAYHMYGHPDGPAVNHALTNLISAPFVPEKVQRELSGAHEYFKIKERCLFCDIYEEEVTRRERGKEHGIIDETPFFSSFIPFFAGHPFEISIQPIEHFSTFTAIPEWKLADLARLVQSVFQRLVRSLGPVPLLCAMMNRPNPGWGSNRGYWQTIDQDWHWRLRIIPEIGLIDEDLRGFFHGTGSRINPVLPEIAAQFLRSL